MAVPVETHSLDNLCGGMGAMDSGAPHLHQADDMCSLRQLASYTQQTKTLGSIAVAGCISFVATTPQF
jgi:hypothetical protein